VRRVRVALLCALLLGLGGCGGTAGRGGGSAKSHFAAAADRICASHLKAVMNWLDQPGDAADQTRQNAIQDEGIYEIMNRSISRLEDLGQAPGPHRDAFGGYVKTLKARAALYRLTSVAFFNQDTIFAIQLEKRISQIDAQGDREAHAYGLQICGTDFQDVGKAFKAAGWSPRAPAS
jgi:hypothetical protein